MVSLLQGRLFSLTYKVSHMGALLQQILCEQLLILSQIT